MADNWILKIENGRVTWADPEGQVHFWGSQAIWDDLNQKASESAGKFAEYIDAKLIKELTDGRS